MSRSTSDKDLQKLHSGTAEAAPSGILPRLSFTTLCIIIAMVLIAFAAFYGVVLPTFKGHDANVVKQCFLAPALIVFSICFWKATARVEAADTRRVIWWAVGFALLTLLIPPFHSRDIYGYINRGWEQVHYGLNPYVYPIKSITNWQHDPMLTDHWIGNPSPYGFLFMLVSRMLCQLGLGSPLATLLLFKSFNLIVYAGCGWLIFNCAKGLGTICPTRALALFLWNPLILLNHLASGHNDLLMGTCQILAIYAMIRCAWLWVIPALTLGALFKYGSLILIPGVALYMGLTQGWAITAGGIGVSVLIAAATGAPYLLDAQHIRYAALLENGTVLSNSPQSVVIYLYRTLAHKLLNLDSRWDKAVGHACKIAFWGGFGLGFLAWCGRILQTARRMPVEGLVAGMVFIQFLLICVTSSKFYPWYLGAVLPMALVLPAESRLHRLILLMSITWLFAFTFLGAAHVLNVLVMTGVPVAWVMFRPRHVETRKPLIIGSISA